ncbi:TonB-dependent receptor [Maribacter sp. 4U21]|uniref:carboxypeptidase-like regulatory domain-containing protein n=1 Tax=Maribacter sp. 4U21 TaxID=1889779 RepID=UPI000C14CD55|nr:carboxypeptidase-like regulatory domain-containing protein [Maribacter sp. 4U21]PIB29038.1 TonB-dependent receptor [Maribacter sp. 4U21]
MGKAHLNTLTSYLLSLLLLLFWGNSKAQDTASSKIAVTTLIQELESTYGIKFSYVDEDLKEISVSFPNDSNLEVILNDIRKQTQLKIEKLNSRYYSISKSTTVDICAQVLDNYESNTIPGASVQVLGSTVATVTNSEGSFSFTNIPRKSIIQVKHLGFKTLFITAEELVQAQPCKILALAQNYQELDEVIVYKFLTDGLAKLKDGSVQLNTEEFGILPGLIVPDILQTIQALPGIRSVDETVSDINIRGGTNDQNLILWDGIKMYQSGHFFGLISAFNPYLTDKISVIKNGTSATYGDGVSGVLDMRTKNKIETTIFGGAGFNLISGDAYAQIPIKENLAVQFSGRRSYTDFLNTPTYNNFSEKAFQDSEIETDSDFYFYDFTGKVLYDINPYQRVRLSLISIDNRLDYLESNETCNRSIESNLDQTNLSFGGTLESDWTDRFSSNLNLYYTRYRLNALSISNEARQRLVQNNRVVEKSAKLSTKYKFNESLQWTNGYQVVETGIQNTTELNEPTFISDIKGVVYTHSLYSEMNYNSANQKLVARAGARLNYIENVNTFQKLRLEPRLNISYELAPHFKTELLGEFKSQSTNQIIDLEQNFLGIEKRRWVLADESTLPVTTSKQASLGINYDENSFYFGIEGFFKEVQGINVNTQGFQNQGQFNGEIGAYTNKGVEVLINKKNNYYSAWLSYTYNLNNYTFETLEPPSFPNNLDIRHAITLAGNYTYGNLKIGFGLNYRSGRPFTEPDEDNPIDTTVFPNEINYREPNSSRISEYFRMDASAIYDFNLNKRIKASFGASILNLTNRRNTLNTYYRLSDANEIEQIQRVSLGVTPNASFRVYF